MKKIVNSRIFIFILGIMITTTLISVYALSADQVNYNDTTVDQALDELYQKKSVGVQVATLTTQNATYTMQNDGYITGTASRGSSRMALLYLNGKTYALSNWESDDDTTYYVSIYAQKDTVVKTRSNGGTYNLTVYEWK